MKPFQALFLGACVLAVYGCYIGAGSFAGKSCETNNECPKPYSCVQVRVGGRTCELVHGLEGGSYGVGTGGGSGSGGGGGTVVLDPDYCHDVKPILDATCISNCHGLAMDYPGTRKDFRLDYYTPMGGDTLPGVKAHAAGILNRVTADDMPPTGTHMTLTERNRVIKWVNTGFKECLDSGSLPASDAGTGDGGTADAGDGG